MLITKETLKNGFSDSIKLGKKAKNLIKLNFLSKKHGFNLPEFSIIPPNIVNKYNYINKISIKNVEHNFIDFMEIPKSVKDIYIDLYSSNKDVFNKAFDITNSEHKPLIRSSMHIDENSQFSFAGANFTYYSENRCAEEFLVDGISDSVAGLYKTYSEWYMARIGMYKEPRTPSIIMFKYIPDTFKGLAHASKDEIELYLGLDSPKHYEKHIIKRKIQQDKKFKHAKLVGIINSIFQDYKANNMEIEFRISNHNYDDIYMLQAREVYKHYNNLLTPHKNILNCCDLPQDMNSLENIIYGVDLANTTFLINHEQENKESLDASSLIMYLNMNMPNIKLSVVGVYNKNAPSTHLMTAINEGDYMDFSLINKKELNNYLKTKQNNIFLSKHHNNKFSR